MKRFFTETFIWIALAAFQAAKVIDASLTHDYIAYFLQEFMKEHVTVVELEIDGKRTTVMPEEFVFSRKESVQ